MTLIILIVTSLAALSFLGGFFVAKVQYKRDIIFKSLDSGSLPYWRVLHYADKILEGAVKYASNNKEKDIIKEVAAKMQVVVKDEPFNPYEDKKGHAKFYVAQDFKVYFTSDGNWQKRMARTLAHAFKYAIDSDPDSEMKNIAWFSYMTRLVEDEDGD